jgi:hypothetical protein
VSLAYEEFERLAQIPGKISFGAKLLCQSLERFIRYSLLVAQHIQTTQEYPFQLRVSPFSRPHKVFHKTFSDMTPEPVRTCLQANGYKNMEIFPAPDIIPKPAEKMGLAAARLPVQKHRCALLLGPNGLKGITAKMKGPRIDFSNIYLVRFPRVLNDGIPEGV